MPADHPFLGIPVRMHRGDGIALSENLYRAGSHLAPHVHDHAFFSLTLAGGYVESHGRRELDYGVSSVSFHPPFEQHAVSIGTAEVRCLNVDVDAAWLATRLYAEFRSWSGVASLTAEALVLQMLAVVAKLELEKSDRLQPRWISALEEILREEYRSSLKLADLAARVGLHPVHLSRAWRCFRGSSLSEYVQRLTVSEPPARFFDPQVFTGRSGGRRRLLRSAAFLARVQADHRNDTGRLPRCIPNKRRIKVPRPKTPAVTAPQAHYILEKLIDERTVSAADVRRHLAAMWEEMSVMERRLADLRDLAGAMRHPVRAVKARLKRRRMRAVTPEVARSRALQGQYIGLLRQVPEGDRKRFADIARTKGREAAVAALKKRLGK